MSNIYTHKITFNKNFTSGNLENISVFTSVRAISESSALEFAEILSLPHTDTQTGANWFASNVTVISL